jgi:hypothetical protein
MRSQEDEAAKTLMPARERDPALVQFPFVIVIKLTALPDRVIKVRIADEVVFFAVISTDEYQRKCPSGGRAIRLINATIFPVNESAGLIIPPAQVVPEAPGCLIGEIDEDCFNANLDRASIST